MDLSRKNNSLPSRVIPGAAPGDAGGSGRLLRFTRRRCEAGTTTAPAIAEFFAFLGSHLFPALVHALFDSAPAFGAMRPAKTMASKENAAESQQSESLPEGNLVPSEERRRQPVPEMHHQLAANPDEKPDRRRTDKNKR